MGRSTAKVVGIAIVLFVAGWIGVKVLGFFLGAFGYVLAGAVVIGGGVYLYGRVRRAVTRDTRTQRRLEAAARTYRMRQR
jgi:hypothetical protein